MIKLITIHAIHNFGSALQAAALQQYIIHAGYQVEIIDYRPKYLELGRKGWKQHLGRLLNYRVYGRRKKKFDNFVSDHMILTKRRYDNMQDLERFESAADLFIAGGDQLWNDYHTAGRDDAYKLKFVESGSKIAFGTSMGRDNYRQEEIGALLPQIQDFHFIGLREKSSVDFLKNAGMQNVAHVVDPTLLFDRAHYEEMAIEPSIERYALVYLVKRSPLLDQVMEYVRKEFGLKIAYVSGFRKKCDCDYLIKDAGPREIVGLIKNAEFVVSASFHATLFALIFNRQFVSLLPHVNTNARIIELLEMVGLRTRILEKSEDIANMEKVVDFSSANKILEKFSEVSKTALIEALKVINND